MTSKGFLATGLAVLGSQSNKVPTREGVCVPWPAGALLPPSVCSLHGISPHCFPKAARMPHSPPPAHVGLLPTTVILHHVVRMLLAAWIQRSQQLGLRGRGQSHAQEPAQRAPRHHRQPGQVRRQSQLLEGLTGSL